MPWSSETKWRQGSVLSAKYFETLGIQNANGMTFALAISHDCDICNDKLEVEPFVEFVLGKFVDTCQGNNEFGKNPRVLHLPTLFEGKAETIELSAPNKVLIAKIDLNPYEPDERYSLEQKHRRILQDWLAARYKRQALPDSLNARLKHIVDFLDRQGKKFTSGVLGYWIDYDPRDIELSPEESYEFWLYVVYSNDIPEHGVNATKIAEELKSNFGRLISKTAEKGSVDLRECKAYSEEEFTLSDLMSNIQYRFDYLSHRTDPSGPVV